MGSSPSPGQDWRRSILRRVEAVAAALNPFLMLVVVMLAILDMGCYAALQLSRFQAAHSFGTVAAEPSPAAGHRGDITGPVAAR